MMYYTTSYSSPICPFTLASDGASIVALWLEGQKYYGDGVQGEMTEKDDLPVFAAAKDWLDRYFDGQRPAISELPLAPAGGDFRREVWRILCEIPYGAYTTYGDIAKQMAAKANRPRMSAQAVGGAVGRNPVSVIVPCHRVVGADGSLTGYAGGIDKKIKLLTHEGVDISCLYAPTKGTAL
jgi:methylated-DNA-[protein]-cysteine S-methyltransferase